jgi:uncharacterized C2H2 Zn-finger protein
MPKKVGRVKDGILQTAKLVAEGGLERIQCPKCKSGVATPHRAARTGKDFYRCPKCHAQFRLIDM